jgi:hypothetical protein
MTVAVARLHVHNAFHADKDRLSAPKTATAEREGLKVRGHAGVLLVVK